MRVARNFTAALALVLASAPDVRAQVTTAALEDVAEDVGNVSAPMPINATGGSLGIPSITPTQSVGAQATMLTYKEAAAFVARIGRFAPKPWLALEGIADASSFEVPTALTAPDPQPAVLETTLYQSVGFRAIIGSGAGRTLNDDDLDARVSSCCSLRESFLASKAAGVPACEGAADLDTCVLSQTGLADSQDQCAAIDVPIVAESRCVAEDIIRARLDRQSGLRFGLGVRFLRSFEAPEDADRGWGAAAEGDVRYVGRSSLAYVSGAAVALQSWDASTGDSTVKRLKVIELRLGIGGLIYWRNFALSTALAFVTNRWTDDVTDSEERGRRGEFVFQLSYAISRTFSGSLRAALVKPYGQQFDDWEEYQPSFSAGPSLGGAF